MEDRRHGRWRLARRLAVTAAVIFAAARTGAAGVAGPPAIEAPPGGLRPAKLVDARLVADVEAVQPGKTFAAGVLLTIEPGWHVYWKNPGDAGLATTVRFRLPKGFRAGPPHWPTPMTFRQAGDIVGYGYEKAVLLWAEITPPKTLRPGGSFEIAAEVGYLACRQQCVPGEAAARRRLRVAGKARPADAALFARWRGRLPADPDDCKELASVRVSGQIPPGKKSGRFAVRLKWRRAPRAVEYCPAAGANLMVEGLSVRTARAETRATFTARLLAGARSAPRSLETVAVHIDAKGDRRGVAIRVPLSESGHDPSSRPAK